MMSPGMRRTRVLRVLACVLSAGWALGLALAFVWRARFPLELEWMEGGVLQQALRFTQGKSLYPPPSIDYVPFLYPPLYPMVVGALGTVLPLDFPLARGVSIAATAATCAGIWRALAREGKPLAHRAVGVGLFLSGYVFSFRWFDVARPDSLALALMVWGLVLLRESWGHAPKAVAAGVLMALAFWTKQTAFILIVGSGLAGLLAAPRQLSLYVLTIFVLDGLVLWLANRAIDVWLWHTIYTLHQQHAFNGLRFTQKAWGMLAHAAPWVGLYLVAHAVTWLRPVLLARRRLGPGTSLASQHLVVRHRGRLFWGVMATFSLLAGALGYATQWAEPNAFMPTVALCAVFVAVVLPREGMMEQVGLACVSVQLAFSALLEPHYAVVQHDGSLFASYKLQRPERFVPTAHAQRVATQRREALLRASGEILALSRPWWSILAGGPGHVGSMNLNDVTPLHRGELQRALQSEVRNKRFTSIWLDGEPPTWLREALAGFTLRSRFSGNARVLPLTGYMSPAGMTTPWRGDQIVLEPLHARTRPSHAQVLADFEDGTLQGFHITGDAFGSRPCHGLTGTLPAMGPVGGVYLLSSAGPRGDVALRGVATSASFTAIAGEVVLHVGYIGKRAGLHVMLVDLDRVNTSLAIPLPTRHAWLEEVSLSLPESWHTRTVRLELHDNTAKGAVFADDIWLQASP